MWMRHRPSAVFRYRWMASTTLLPAAISGFWARTALDWCTCPRRHGNKSPPRTAGWYSDRVRLPSSAVRNFQPKSSAGQLQSGMPNFPALFAISAGMEVLLSVGVDRLDQELRPLVKVLRDGLEEQGHTLLTPAGPEFASGIVSIRVRRS